MRVENLSLSDKSTLPIPCINDCWCHLIQIRFSPNSASHCARQYNLACTSRHETWVVVMCDYHNCRSWETYHTQWQNFQSAGSTAEPLLSDLSESISKDEDISTDNYRINSFLSQSLCPFLVHPDYTQKLALEFFEIMTMKHALVKSQSRDNGCTWIGQAGQTEPKSTHTSFTGRPSDQLEILLSYLEMFSLKTKTACWSITVRYALAVKITEQWLLIYVAEHLDIMMSQKQSKH